MSRLKLCERSITSASALDVEVNYAHFFSQLYNAASKLLVLNDFPEEVDKDYGLENLILTGSVSFFNKNDKYYLLDAFIGGEENTEYRPTKIQIANPKLGSFELTQHEDGVMLYLTPFDKLVTKVPSFTGGLYSLISMTAMLLADNITSINCAQVNTRVSAICEVESNNSSAGVEEVLRDIYRGKPYKIVKHGLIDSFKVNPLASATTSKNIIELVELHQYILAQFWNALGIQCNSNMKRERLVTAEVDANFAALKIPVTTMLDSLNEGCEWINKIWGLNTSFGLNPELENEVKGDDEENVSEKNEIESGTVDDNLPSGDE